MEIVHKIGEIQSQKSGYFTFLIRKAPNHYYMYFVNCVKDRVSSPSYLLWITITPGGC